MSESQMMSLSMVSHELRNPLTLIHSSLQIIGNHHPEIKEDPMWSQVNLEIQYMSTLLSEISALNNKEKLSYTKVDIRKLLTELIERFSLEAGRQGKRLRLSFETDYRIIDADALKLREMLLNLIQNALEATEYGDKIEVIVQSKWDKIIFIIKDSGVGMDSERLQTIFDPFVTYKKGGTGLGLVIVKNIVDAHHGVIQVYSKPSAGTKMVVILPRTFL